MSKFTSHYNSGVHITFDNGYTVSIQWGPSTYSQHHNLDSLSYEKLEAPSTPSALANGWSSNTAEVAVMKLEEDKDTIWYNPITLELGDPEGWMTTEQVVDVLQRVEQISVGKIRRLINRCPA